MARGTPDGGIQAYQKAINISDLGEVAVRLLMGGGSLSRTGRLSWATGFEGLPTNTAPADMQGSAVGSGSELIVVQGNTANPLIGFNPINFGPAWQGNNSLAIIAGNTIGNTASAFKYFPYPSQTGRWGLELMILPLTFNTTIDIIMKKVGVPGVNTQTAQVRIICGPNQATISFNYVDSTGTTQLILWLGNIMDVGGGAYYNLKMVVDFTTNKWVGIMFDGYAFDFVNDPTLAANSALQSSAPGVSDKSSIQIVVTSGQSDNCGVQVDNIILTSDEV